MPLANDSGQICQKKSWKALNLNCFRAFWKKDSLTKKPPFGGEIPNPAIWVYIICQEVSKNSYAACPKKNTSYCALRNGRVDHNKKATAKNIEMTWFIPFFLGCGKLGQANPCLLTMGSLCFFQQNHHHNMFPNFSHRKNVQIKNNTPTYI